MQSSAELTKRELWGYLLAAIIGGNGLSAIQLVEPGARADPFTGSMAIVMKGDLLTAINDSVNLSKERHDIQDRRLNRYNHRIERLEQVMLGFQSEHNSTSKH